MIYADNAATTKMSPRALEEMCRTAGEIWGNPSSLYGLGQAAQEAFDAQFKRSEIPDDVPEFPVADVITLNDQGKVYLAKLMADLKLAQSVGEARRFIDGGGVKINGEAVAAKAYNVDPELLGAGTVIQHGKRKFARLV